MKISQLPALATPGPDVAIPVAAGSENFKVTLSQIRGAGGDSHGVVFFAGFATADNVETGSDTLVVSAVIYDEGEQRFYGRSTVNGRTVCYRNWKTMGLFMDEDEIIHDDRLYVVDTGDGFGELYFVVDDFLRRAGFTEAEAARLKTLETRVNELEQAIGRLTNSQSD